MSPKPEATGPRVGHVSSPVRGRYLVREAAGPAPLLVGFHGYGETAAESLAELDAIPGAADWHRAAIQALHPFYKNRTGEVAASWMTQLDRELAIDDNVAYVDKALTALAEGLAVDGPLVLAGFSQGTAMTWRAAARSTDRCAGVISLGGDVPPELAEADWRSRPAVLLGRGTGDTWYDEAKLEADLELLAAAGLEVEVQRFDAGHEWTDEFRTACTRFLGRLRQPS